MIPYLLAALGGYLIGESQKKETEKSDAPQMAKGGETGAASMKIKLKDGIISVYHSDGSKLLSWKAKKGDWDKIWDKFNYLGHQTLATGGELGAAEIKVQLKNGNITIFHSDGRKLYGWKANSGDWDEIWDRLYELSGSKMEDGGMMAKGGLTDEIKLYYHKTSGGAEYLMSTPVEGTKEGSFDSKYTIRIDGAKKYGGELYIKDENDRKEIKLYYHKTSGGAEYLMSTPVEGTNEGSFDSEYIVRIDGAKNKGGELIISTIKMPMIYADGGMMAKGGSVDTIDYDKFLKAKVNDYRSQGYDVGESIDTAFRDLGLETNGRFNKIKLDKVLEKSHPNLKKQWKEYKKESEIYVKDGDYVNPFQYEMMAKGGRTKEDTGLSLKKGSQGITYISGQPNPDFFNNRYEGWWKSPNNYSIKKFEELVKKMVPTEDIVFDSESGMFYAEGRSDAKVRKFYRDLIDSATMDYPSEFPFKTDKEYFNWQAKRFREAKKKIGNPATENEAIDEFYFEMFSNYGEKSVKNELKKLFAKINSAEMGDSDSKYHISEEKAIRMVADVFKNVNEFNTEVYDTEPENSIIFFAEEKFKKRGYPRKYYDNLKQRVQEANY